MRMLQPGDPCPCCGQPIRSKDPAVLELLTEIAMKRRLLTVEDILAISRREEVQP